MTILYKEAPTCLGRGNFGHGKIEWRPECGWVLNGEGAPYEMWNGLAAYIHMGMVFRLSTQGGGLKMPDGREYIAVGKTAADTPYREALKLSVQAMQGNLTELEGPHALVGPGIFGDPYGIGYHVLWPLTMRVLSPFPEEVTIETMQEFLKAWPIMGIYFVHPDGRDAVLSRYVFGYTWPVEGARL